MRADIHIGDCRDVLATMPDASVHAVVCDPPYGIGFMGMAWDTMREGGQPRSDSGFDHVGGNHNATSAQDAARTRRIESVRFGEWCRPWLAEVFRVLRPGGHLVAFGGTRTHHRMFCAIEDAGFEIRDCLAYLFGSGFPKSLDVSKAIDKAAGLERPIVSTEKKPDKRNGNYHGASEQRAPIDWNRTSAASAASAAWDGWGTALKPAYEPICLSRKPLSESSVAKNVLRWGTGALNIDGCRIPVDDDNYARNCSGDRGHDENRTRELQFGMTAGSASLIGRWPANVCLDEEAAGMLDEQAGERTSGANPKRRGSDKFRDVYGEFAGQQECSPARGADSGGASRFFFTAKPSVAERESGLAHIEPRTRNRVNAGGLENDPKWAPTTRRNTHPTVKPFDLMSWLVRLVTPPGGIVCDPFLGSGSTGMAAVAEGFDFIGIEQDASFAEIAEGRIRNVAPLLVTTEIHTTAEPCQPTGSVAAGSVTGPKPGTAGVRSPGRD